MLIQIRGGEGGRLLFGSGCKTRSCVKFQDQIRDLGSGGLTSESCGEGFAPEPNSLGKMAKIGDERKEDEQYATAVEVDGIRRTLDIFMKQQEVQNEKLSASLDQLMASMSKVAAKVGISSLEDQASAVKGKKVANNHDLKHVPPETDFTFQAHRSVHGGPHIGMP